MKGAIFLERDKGRVLKFHMDKNLSFEQHSSINTATSDFKTKEVQKVFPSGNSLISS